MTKLVSDHAALERHIRMHNKRQHARTAAAILGTGTGNDFVAQAALRTAR